MLQRNSHIIEACPRPWSTRARVELRLAALAAICLLAGLAVYVFGRPLPLAWLPDSLWAQLSPLRDARGAGGWLAVAPSLLHACAMVLALGALSHRSPRVFAGVALAWCGVSLVLESSQRGGPLAALAVGPARGTFDPHDLAATVLGALAAVGVVFLLGRQHRYSNS